MYQESGANVTRAHVYIELHPASICQNRHRKRFDLDLQLDSAGWRRESCLNIPANMRLASLPPYSPELNPVEHIWDEVRENYFGNLVFDSLDFLEEHLEAALRSMELDLARVQSIVAWPWIINSLMI